MDLGGYHRYYSHQERRQDQSGHQFQLLNNNMRRPDQDKFDMFARHFGSIDHAVEVFCKTHIFQLEKNYFRQPSRVLKREGNPSFLIDIGLSEHWLKIKYEEDMPHTITAIGYYEPPDSATVWRVAHKITNRERFSQLQEKLFEHLEEAVRLINEWTPEVIMQKGKPSENLKQKYGTA